MATELLPTGYADFIDDVKTRIRAARVRAVLAVNHEMVMLYWQIGHAILERQEEAGWGAKVIDRLSRDLRHEFPDTKGFSARNLKYMRAFAAAWPDESIVQQVAAQIPGFHNCRLPDRLHDPEQHVWNSFAFLDNQHCLTEGIKDFRLSSFCDGCRVQRIASTRRSELLPASGTTL